MLQVIGFESAAVVVGDLYFLDPSPLQGQEGAERGVRVEVRLLERGELHGSIYSARPIGIGRPVWRVDLLESVDGPPGTFDRTHHHPRMDGWEVGSREFDAALTSDPLGWLGAQLGDLGALAERAGVREEIDPGDAERLRAAIPEVLDVVGRTLARVHGGELAAAPTDPGGPEGHRAGWL